MAMTKKAPAKKAPAKKTSAKQAPAKKAPAKKAPAKKKASGTPRGTAARSASHRRLSLELTELLPGLDEEGLAFLVQQAHVHLHNMAVDRLEAEAVELASGTKTRARGAKGAAGHDVTKDRSSPANFRVERSASGASYHLISGGKWKMFSEGEMAALVKIAHGPGSTREVGKRLHRWLADERQDAFPDLEIGDERDPKMAELAEFLRAKFALKG